MLSIIYFFIMILIILIFMMLINLIFSKKNHKHREKMSAFECGFDPVSNSRMPFSLQFYLITIIFLIFDVEIALMLPMIYSMNFMYYILNWNFTIIVLILIFGLFLEMKEGALNWFK